MQGLLLDSSTFLWLDGGFPMLAPAILAIEDAARSDLLFVSPISAWEIGVADGKKRISGRPPLRGLTPSSWFERAIASSGAKIANFTLDIALESARLPTLYGSGDPGDCFLIATAHVLSLTLITRDVRMLAFAGRQPNVSNDHPVLIVGLARDRSSVREPGRRSRLGSPFM